MRATRRLAVLTASLLLGAAALEGAATTAQSAPARDPQVQQVAPVAAHVAARKARKVRLASWGARTVRAIPGQDQITVVWPARSGATGYTVEWAPTGESLGSSPAACRWPCKRKYTRSTRMVLSAADLSSYGRNVSSRSGNTLRFKVFAHRGRAIRATGPNAWVGPSATTSVNWLPSPNSQMPLPYAAAAGTDVAVTSFNVLTRSDWLDRAAKVVNQINSTGASIVATQENTNSPVYGSTSQYQDLANRLGPSGWALADARNWDRASGGTSSTSTQATRIYFKTGVWTQVQNGALMTHVPANGQNSGVWVDRWMSWTKLRSNADPSTQVCVVDLHLLSNLTTNFTPWAQHRNAEIAQLVSELKDPNSPVRRVGTRLGAACAGTPTVIAGDFNAAQPHAPWGNMPVSTLLGNGFVDTKNAAARYNTRWTGPGTVNGWHETFGTQIDYLLASGVGGAKAFWVNAAPPSVTGSDHFPVTTVVSVPQS